MSGVRTVLAVARELPREVVQAAIIFVITVCVFKFVQFVRAVWHDSQQYNRGEM